jgi:AraC-like DNA-binding protein
MKLLQDYQAAESEQIKLMDEQTESKGKLSQNQKLIGLLAGLLVVSGVLFLFYRFYATRRKATLLQQLEKYRQEVERWERQAMPDKEEDRSLLERLISRMEQEKPWLNPNLKMEELIYSLNCNRKALFAELKTAHIPGLTQLVNQYRVEEAMRLMEAPGYEMIKTEAIGMESGFGSYSSFHRAFEQINGITPNSYRRQLTQKSDATH